ncbi:MAG: valine--tRNA ligase [Nocardioides sp.]
MTQTPPYAQEPTTATRDVVVPDKPALEGLEATWSQTWKDQGTYVFDRTQPRESVYSIDTPPPTASGALHVGHVFSYTHADLIARFQRMRGKTVFYPMGWDDNGLPTERRVQNFYGVRCDPSLPYDPDFTPPDKPDPKRQIPVSRPNFVELCEELIVEDEKKFEELWRTLGLSVDWDESYTTIGEHAQRVSQTAFLRNFARGEAYLQEAPTLWDVTFRTAVAQAELEAREYPGAYHRVAFHRQSVVEETDGRLDTKLFIETTRPELIAACVALIAHPDDERYADLIASGATVTSPVFGVELPVLAHEAAEPDKGSGLVMCCTFGDLTDVQWWRELNLPVRTVIGRDGRVLADTPEWLSSERASRAYAELAGKTTFSAREAMVAMLRESGDLDGEPKPTQRMTNFYEKGDKPLEIVSTRQWYIRNGGRDGEIRAEMLARGAELDWVPEHMRHRYDNWVKGLNGDWLISRQRFFGVPFPVWYPLDDEGEPDYAHPLVPRENELPIDPSTQAPHGYDEDQRGKPGGFLGDPDIMDTWATSSLTPHIAGGWLIDDTLWSQTFPYDLCTHAHDIIRTWLFSRVVRAHYENHGVPWRHVMISGFVTAGTGKGKQGKLSKSAANSKIDPENLLATHGADAVRWRAAMTRPGLDSPFDEQQIKVGRRLAMKVLNASKFVLGSVQATNPDPALATEAVDRALLARLAETARVATAAFEKYDYTTALESAEKFFWEFCDDYLELVKERAYAENGGVATESAKAALATALHTVLRLLAPFLPYVTEEVWSWWQEGSIHRAPWPDGAEWTADGDPTILTGVAAALTGVRGAKSAAKVSMRAEVARATVRGPEMLVGAAEQAAADLARAARVIGTLEFAPDAGSEVSVDVELAPVEA